MQMQALERRLIRDFYDVGFFVLSGVFDLEEVEAMREAFVRLHDTAQELGDSGLVKGAQFVVEPRDAGDTYAERVKIHRICWCGAAEPILMEAGRDPRMLSVVREILESEEADHLINQAHFKMPGDGVSFPWHQDSVHRRYGTPLWTDVNGKGSYVQALLALDEVTEENGPLYFVPGSSKLGHLEALAHRKQAEQAGGFPFDPSTAVPALMTPGSVVFFGPYTIHGSWPNRSTQPRRVLINGYASPGANRRTYPGEGAGVRISLMDGMPL